MENLSEWFNNLDGDAMAESLADDVVVEHVTTGRRLVGKEAVLTWLAGIRQRSAEDRIEIIRSTVDGSTIWAERVDRHLIDGQWREIPVVGIIQLNNDQQVVLMRDYFDPELAL